MLEVLQLLHGCSRDQLLAALPAADVLGKESRLCCYPANTQCNAFVWLAVLCRRQHA
jgi:hypothetical protein